MPLNDGSQYQLLTELWVSATENAVKPMGRNEVAAKQTIGFQVKATAVYALNLVLTGQYADQQIFTKEEVGAGISFLITYNDAVKSIGMTLEIQEKSGDVYLTRKDLIDKI